MVVPSVQLLGAGTVMAGHGLIITVAAVDYVIAVEAVDRINSCATIKNVIAARSVLGDALPARVGGVKVPPVTKSSPFPP